MRHSLAFARCAWLPLKRRAQVKAKGVGGLALAVRLEEHALGNGSLPLDGDASSTALLLETRVHSLYFEESYADSDTSSEETPCITTQC